jgi:ABC-type transport system involved in multi-copper enzyme maturation permease subunit
MKVIVAIAKNTFKEAIRNRVLYVILMFALILIGFSGMLSQLSVAAQDRVVKDLGFMSINLFGVAIAIFVGVSLVYNELEKKTIYTIVSKPIGRWQFLLGKYFGLLMTVCVNVLVMTLFFLAALHYYDARSNPGPVSHGTLFVVGQSILRAFVTFFLWSQYSATANVMPVIAVTLLEMGIITAFAVLFSSFSTPTLSMFFTVLTFIAGRLNEHIIRYADQVRKQALEAAMTSHGWSETVANWRADMPLSYYLSLAAAHVMPNLGAFHKTVDQAIYGSHIQLWWGTILYGFLYIAGILSLAILIFNRRNFK